MLIRFQSAVDRPPHRVSCDLMQDEQVSLQLEGSYRDQTWLFTGPDDDTWDRCRLRLDGQLIIVAETARPKGNAILDLDRIPGLEPVIWPDGGQLARVWFGEDERDEDLWDVIIIGQGMGGGVLHAALADRVINNDSKLLTLGLEAGGLLFPTHVANLPRVFVNANPGGTPSMWSTLDTFGRHANGSTDPNDRNFEIFALGGRSLYWGGLTPRVDRREIERWGSGVIARELFEPAAGRRAYYAAAEQLLGVGSPPAGPLQHSLIELVDGILPGRDTRPAPMAVKRLPPTSERLPTGLFSTAELLLEQRLSNGDPDGSFGRPYIHLNELTEGIAQGPDGTWTVHTVRLPDGTRVRHRARVVVLSAGTVETIRIVHASGLSIQSVDSIGSHFTEHAMAYRHFQIPPGSPFHDPIHSSHVLSMPGPSGAEWNLQVQLGSDALLDRRLTDLGRTITTVVRPGWIAGQIVFLGRTDLDPTGQVTAGDGYWMDLDNPGTPNLPPVSLQYANRELYPEWQDVSDRLMGALGADALDGEKLLDAKGPALSAPGVVSHEVGTMHLGADAQPGVVDDDLQVNGLPGLYVCDNSVFATSPAANPSLTLAALALRLADHLVAGASQP